MPAVGLVPLERLVAASQFDGTEGRSRAPAKWCTLALPRSDHAVTCAWLSQYEARDEGAVKTSSPHT